jgi:hypothetical protein
MLGCHDPIGKSLFVSYVSCLIDFDAPKTALIGCRVGVKFAVGGGGMCRQASRSYGKFLFVSYVCISISPSHRSDSDTPKTY